MEDVAIRLDLLYGKKETSYELVGIPRLRASGGTVLQAVYAFSRFH